MDLNDIRSSPRLVTKLADLRAALAEVRRAGKSIGLVPTMGALHAGHISLVERSRRECDFTVVSIFVNPTQFGPQEDFARYPRDLDADLRLLQPTGADLVFAPELDEVYGPRHATFVEMHGVAEPLEGRCRPGHFRGVATVVLKLFNMVTPDRAYFGQKDYQQSLVIRRLVADLDLPIEIRVCPTVREPDGLALSSRNVYLTAAERHEALAISRALRRAGEVVQSGERRADAVLAAMQAVLAESPGLSLEYLAIVDAETLEPVAIIDQTAIAAVAAFVGRTRLIDNVLLTP
ncbi:MAG TPA: pantoate--beta-alanine ligase [Pirellulales bacterium]|nr:pantoate--beta-alanine ligase [Pirellulales bacterium]